MICQEVAGIFPSSAPRQRTGFLPFTRAIRTRAVKALILFLELFQLTERLIFARGVACQTQKFYDVKKINRCYSFLRSGLTRGIVAGLVVFVNEKAIFALGVTAGWGFAGSTTV